MAQTGCTEEKAKEALAAENGDLINASECSERSSGSGKEPAVGDLRARPGHAEHANVSQLCALALEIPVRRPEKKSVADDAAGNSRFTLVPCIYA